MGYDVIVAGGGSVRRAQFGPPDLETWFAAVARQARQGLNRACSLAVERRVSNDKPAPGADQLPAAVGRTVYRVIQEGLTNARKHAPDAPVQVTATADAQAVTAEVISRRCPATAARGTAEPAGTGAGLIGLAERVTLADGQLEHGPNAIGDFVLRATIPRQP